MTLLVAISPKHRKSHDIVDLIEGRLPDTVQRRHYDSNDYMDGLYGELSLSVSDSCDRLNNTPILGLQ